MMVVIGPYGVPQVITYQEPYEYYICTVKLQNKNLSCLLYTSRYLCLISEIIEKWIKGILIDGITGNLSGLFDNVNAKVGEICLLYTSRCV